jgi:hypothetical protein
MPSTSSSPTDLVQPAGTLTPVSRTHDVPFPARCSHCDASLAGRYCHVCGEDSTVALGLALAAAWNIAAARRIGAHRWPMAVAKGFAVVVAGFIIDSVMSIDSIWLALRLA